MFDFWHKKLSTLQKVQHMSNTNVAHCGTHMILIPGYRGLYPGIFYLYPNTVV